MIFKKALPQNLTKLYLAIDPTSKVDFQWLADSIFECLASKPVAYAVNYGADKNISKFQGAISAGGVEYLEVLDTTGALLLTIGKWAIGKNEPDLYQCMVVGRLDEHYVSELKIMKRFAIDQDLVYGYSRELRSDYNPASETRIKRGFFSTETKSESSNVWMFNSQEMLAGSVKGVYPVNYWRTLAIEKLQNVGFSLPKTIAGEGVYLFNAAQQQEIARENQQFLNFVRFDGHGT
ncbi:hypothetical protein FNU76_19905 [Chitinimonas arctica]|uniref:Uncharacterized protein n=1 Tax=Chitinimonas arctica TaxID=2594795 RepID=A0A516SJV8_9NEIS|nr:hypothetical protein [Chitinimonas arctica]QDQ28439.1 hypothetical protein FNU76_19905 [Chitinimonas arctica]